MSNNDIMNTENNLSSIEENTEFLARRYGDASWFSDDFSEMPYANDAFLLGTQVAGTSHIENISELFFKLNEGDRLILIREPENVHDNRAIRIESSDGEKIGYVPHYNNLILSRLMDAGYYLYGKVRLLEIHNENYYYIVVKIYISFSEYGIRNDELLKISEAEDDLEIQRGYPDVIKNDLYHSGI